MNPLIQSKNTTILPVLIALTLGCFGLSPQARADGSLAQRKDFRVTSRPISDTTSVKG